LDTIRAAAYTLEALANTTGGRMSKASEKAVKAYRARLIEAGGSRLTVILSAQATQVLERLAKVYGSRTKAIESLINEKGE